MACSETVILHDCENEPESQRFTQGQSRGELIVPQEMEENGCSKNCEALISLFYWSDSGLLGPFGFECWRGKVVERITRRCGR